MRLIAIIVFAVFSATVASAYVVGGTNFGFSGYPKHSCFAPYNKPSRPYQFESEYELESYNAAVRRYNDELSMYMTCIRDYLDNAENDIRRIKDAINEASSI